MTLVLKHADAGSAPAAPPISNAGQLAAREKKNGAPMPGSRPAHDLRLFQGPPDGFVPLDQETRTHVVTAVMCRHLNRREQTARGWASAETYPKGLKPLRVNGRLAWPVAGIKQVLGVT